MIEPILFEHHGGYAARTRHNAGKAHLTAAFAMDFTTAGEKLTCRLAGKKYVAIPLTRTHETAAQNLQDGVRAHDAHILNIAGNGIHTLSRYNWTQEAVNEYLFYVLKSLRKSRPSLRVVSGGQTGVDIAGIIAACALDIPNICTFPSGFLQRNRHGQDIRRSEGEVRQEIITSAMRLLP